MLGNVRRLHQYRRMRSGLPERDQAGSDRAHEPRFPAGQMDRPVVVVVERTSGCALTDRHPPTVAGEASLAPTSFRRASVAASPAGAASYTSFSTISTPHRIALRESIRSPYRRNTAPAPQTSAWEIPSGFPPPAAQS